MKRRSLFMLGSLLTGYCLLSTAPVHAVIVSTMPSNNSLIGYWKFDEARTNKTRDYSGNGNTGTLTNFADPATAESGWTTSGKVGGAITFIGQTGLATSTYVTMAASTAMKQIASDLTLAAWVYPTSFQGGNGTIVRIGDGADERGALLITPSNLLGFAWYDGAFQSFTTGSVPLNRWTHVAAVKSGLVVSMYVDGVFVASSTVTNPTVVPSTTNIGATLPTEQAFNGKIDEVRMYNRALSASEIATLTRTPTVSGVAAAPGSTFSDGLVGRWTFDGKDVAWAGASGTTTIRDVTGNGFNGSIYGVSMNSLIPGKVGQSLKFSGLNSRGVILGTDPALNPSTFTISAWVKTSSSTYSYNYIYSNSRDCCGSPYNGIDFYISSGGIVQAGIWNGATKSSVTASAGTVPVNVWTHVTFSFDGTTLRLYRNGVVVGSSTASVSVGSPASYPSFIGSMGISAGGGTQYTLNGLLDDVRLYSRALSNTEISSLYKISSGGKMSASPSAAPSESSSSGINGGLVGYWTFDGSKLTATTALDSSGLGNNGTVSNSTSYATLGKIGQGIRFNSATTTGVITINSNPASLQLATGTLSAWIKTSNAGTSYRGIISKSSAYGMYLLDNVFAIYDNGASTYRSTGVNLADNKWHHVAVTFSSGVTNGTILYIDGVARLTTTMTNTGQEAVPSIGRGQGGSTQVFNGAIDDMRVYNRILSASEIYNLYRLGTR